MTINRDGLGPFVETFAASFTPGTADPEKRTVRCVAYSGAKIPRMDWYTGEPYDMTLSMDKSAVRLSRFNSGAPICDSHMTYSVMNCPGVVERGWIENGKLYADLRFSPNDEITPLWNNIQAGIVRNVSIGAWIYAKRDTTEKDSDRQQFLAIDWEPYELSVVPVPADKSATMMAAEPVAETITTGLQPKGEKSMENPVAQTGNEARTTVTTPATAPPVVDIESIKAAAKQEEKERASAIRKLCASVKLDEKFSAQLIEESVTLEAARARVIDAIAARAPETETTAHVAVTKAQDEKMRENMTATLLYRSDPVLHKDKAELAKSYRATSLMEMAKECLAIKGVQWKGMNAGDIAMAAITRSDLANVLADVSNKTLRAAYEAAPQTFRPFCRRATATDFKNINRVQLAGAPPLLKVNEDGEITQGRLYDSKETYFLLTYARIVNISRQTIINDDLDALTRIPAAFGQKASQLESNVVWAIVTANAAMSDGVALFHATHGNLGTTGAISVTTVDEAYTGMSLQTAPDGDVLNLEPKFILIPTGKRAITNQFLNAGLNAGLAVTAFTSQVPGYMQNLIPIAESRLQANSSTAFYFVADPAVIDTIEYCYLEGQEGVYQETQMGFEVDGMKLKARLDFAAAAIDHRGMYKNAGA